MLTFFSNLVSNGEKLAFGADRNLLKLREGHILDRIMDCENASRLTDRQIELEIENIQLDLRGYVTSLTGPMGDVEEVMQQTSIFVWERRAEFKAGTSFKAWAFSVARYKVLGLRRDAKRRGHVVYSEETIDHIARVAEEKFHDTTDNQQIAFLEQCVKTLKHKEQLLIQEFYTKGRSLTAHAERVGKSVAAIHKAMSRVRMKLRDCINQKQNRES